MPKLNKSEGIMPSRKAQIEADLKKNPNDPRYSFFTPKKSKSAVWQNFNVVKFNELIESYAQCNGCKDILAYSAKSGTGSLLRHKCSKRANSHPKEYKYQIKKCEDMSTESADDNEPTESEIEDSINLNEHHNAANSTRENLKETTIEMASSSASTYSNVDKTSTHDNELPDYYTCNISDVKPAIIKDKYDVFGENVASEMRQLQDVQDVQFQLKVMILKSILDANNTAQEIRKSLRNQTN